MTRETDISVDIAEDDGVLVVRAQQDREFQGFDGEVVEAPVTVAEIRIPANADLAEALGHALLGWYAEQQPAGPPGQKPMHQQMAEVEPDR